jgi:hypothetical protein
MDYFKKEVPSEYSDSIRITRLLPIGSPIPCLYIVPLSMQCDVTVLLGESTRCSVLNMDCEYVLKEIAEMLNTFGSA